MFGKRKLPLSPSDCLYQLCLDIIVLLATSDAQVGRGQCMSLPPTSLWRLRTQMNSHHPQEKREERRMSWLTRP